MNLLLLCSVCIMHFVCKFTISESSAHASHSVLKAPEIRVTGGDKKKKKKKSGSNILKIDKQQKYLSLLN